MTYHSFKWWIAALQEQTKHFFRNIICRKILKVEFGYTEADLLTLFIEENKHMLYHFLVNKYPELNRLEKYLKINKAFTLLEFLSASIFFSSSKTISTFWKYDAELEDIYFLLKNEISCIVHIRNVLNQPHSVAVVACDDTRREIIYNDPLGDPFLRYKCVFGFNIRATIDRFLASCIGKPIRMSFFIKSKEINKIKRINLRFDNHHLYSLQYSDFEHQKFFDKEKYILSRYSANGKIEIDLGENAKNKFLHCYVEYNNKENILWDINNLDILKIAMENLNYQK